MINWTDPFLFSFSLFPFLFSTINRTSPVMIASDVQGVSTDGYSTIFLKNDGTMMGMGDNIDGQLGPQFYLQPVLTPIVVATDVQAMTAGRVAYNLFITKLSYEDWLAKYFNPEQLLDPSATSQNADPDGDLLTNFFEFEAKLDPSDAESRLQYSYQPVSNRLYIGPIDPEANILIESSKGLKTWLPLVETSYNRIGDQFEIDLASFTPSVFFRIIVSDEG